MASASSLQYNDLIRLIPELSLELADLQTSLHEHNAWLSRASSSQDAPNSSSPTVAEMTERRDQTATWLHEGEDILRQYRARLSELSTIMGVPGYGDDEVEEAGRDVVGDSGTYRESEAQDGLPEYAKIEYREELMVGVGEELPPYRQSGGPGRVVETSDSYQSTHSSSDESVIGSEVLKGQNH